MSIAVVSDVHGNAAALAAVISRLESEAEDVLFLGDLVGYYSLAHECLEMLRPLSLRGVRGNHDRVLLDCAETGTRPDPAYVAAYGTAVTRSLDADDGRLVSFLRTLPESLVVEVGGIRIALWHGAPWDLLDGRVYPDFQDWDRFGNTDADILLMGHTHYPFERRIGTRLLLNPGSVGQPRDRSGVAEYAVLDPVAGRVRLAAVGYDFSPVLADVAANDPGLPYLAEVLKR
jgi:putative phosphoesterase